MDIPTKIQKKFSGYSVRSHNFQSQQKLKFDFFCGFGSMPRFFYHKNQSELAHQTFPTCSPEHDLFFSENRIEEDKIEPKIDLFEHKD